MHSGFVPVVFVQLLKVVLYLPICFFQAVLYFMPGEVSVAGIGGSEFGAINGDQFAAEQAVLETEAGEFTANLLDGLAVIATEIGDGFKVWRQPLYQPEEFEIPIGFAFERTDGTDSV